MPPLANDVRNAPGVVGKSLEFVYPATYASPAPSTAIANPRSLFEPPSNVEYTGAVPEGFNLTTNASQVRAPPVDVRDAPGVVGKAGAVAQPVSSAYPEASNARARPRESLAP